MNNSNLTEEGDFSIKVEEIDGNTLSISCSHNYYSTIQLYSTDQDHLELTLQILLGIEKPLIVLSDSQIYDRDLSVQLLPSPYFLLLETSDYIVLSLVPEGEQGSDIAKRSILDIGFDN